MQDLPAFFQTSICRLLFPYTVELARKGHFKEAETSLKFMIKHDPLPEYYLLLGKIYAQQGRYQDAIVEWEKVLEIDPENQNAKAAILKAKELLKGIPIQLFKWKLSAVLLAFLFIISLVIGSILWRENIDILSRYRASLKENQKLEKEIKEVKKEVEVSRSRYHEVIKKYKKSIVSYQNLLKNYENFKKQISKQIIIALKAGRRLIYIKGIGSSDITLKLTDKGISVNGEVPTEYLKKVIEETIKGMEGVKSVDIKGLKVTHNYIVSPGDTLYKIAGRLYGDYRKWKDIYKANKEKIKNPNIIHPNDFFNIP